MREDERGTEWSREHSVLHHRSAFKKQTNLEGERNVLRLIATGAPLSTVLNSLCTAIDLQIGSVVSVISLAAREEKHDPITIARRACRFGLSVFWYASIPLNGDKPLGFFEIYSCMPLAPSLLELQLISKATELAELALLSHHGGGNAMGLSIEWKKRMFGRSFETARLN